METGLPKWEMRYDVDTCPAQVIIRQFSARKYKLSRLTFIIIPESIAVYKRWQNMTLPETRRRIGRNHQN